MGTITIGLCDRHTLLRSALEQLLSAEEDLSVVWSVDSLTAADLSQGAPNVILVDFTEPTRELLHQTTQYRAEHPQSQIVALTDHGSEVCVLFRDDKPASALDQPRLCCLQQAFMVGARGAVRKTGTRDELLRVIRAVHAGQVTVEEPSLSLLLTRLFGRQSPNDATPHLTERERDVIRALALGQSNKEIAVSLGIAEQTVKNHVSHILEKLGLEDRVQIVVFAARNRMVSLERI
ncbi:MAG: response regulator transcription factor [Armatimonadetes bacterium]|nr:response regulator transcription factor [Armatimonadota bacterium]